MYLEEVEEGARVETGLLVGGGDERMLVVASASDAGIQVKLKTFGEVVLRLDLGTEDVVGGPHLSEDDAVRLVGVLGLELPGDVLGFVVLLSSDLEGDVGGRDGFDLKAVALDVEVPGQQVVGGLAEILRVRKDEIGASAICSLSRHDDNAPSRMGEQAEGETWWLQMFVSRDVEEKACGEI